MVGFVALLKSRIVLAGWIVYWLAGSYRLYQLAGSYHIAVLLDRWILLDLDRIGWIGWIESAGLAGLDHNGWMRTHGFCKDGTDRTDRMDGLDGSLAVLGW